MSDKRRGEALNKKMAATLMSCGHSMYFQKAKGDSVDKTFALSMAKAIGADVADHAIWTTMADRAGARDALRRVAAGAGGGLDLVFPKEIMEAPFGKPLLVLQPNGSQQWPDSAVLFGRRGMALEYKSAGGDKIVWNSGLPREGGIYVFNGEPGKAAREAAEEAGGHAVSTTYFLGEHILDAGTRSSLKQAAGRNQIDAGLFNDGLKNREGGCLWTLYARPMFNYGGKFLNDSGREGREAATLAFVLGFDWLEE